MAIFNSSSLTFSDLNGHRQRGNGLLKNTKTRVSKQHLVEHRMFGSKRKNIQIGRTFRKMGKGVGSKHPISAHMEGEMHRGISPNIDEFDRMMDGISKGFGSSSHSSRSGTHYKKNKKSLLKRKYFG